MSIILGIMHDTERDGKCAHCGAQFTTRSRVQKYCSACRPGRKKRATAKALAKLTEKRAARRLA